MTPALTSPQSIRHITTITVQMLSRTEPLDQGRGETDVLSDVERWDP